MSSNYQGAVLIAAERLRQIDKEDFDSTHDDNHNNGELAAAAMSYIQHASLNHPVDWVLEMSWPWHEDDFKPSEPIRELVKAGALIAAEIDRLVRIKEDV